MDSEPGKQQMYRTLEVFRGTDQFEDLRLATEIWENEGNKRPSVFMFTIGNLAMRKARAAFSSSFFGCAGYSIIDNAGFNSVEEGVDSALKSEAEVVVICSSDEEYAVVGPEIARALKASKPEVIVVVAGQPKDIIDTLKEAGVDEFISVKNNVLDTLYNFQRRLEVMY
jgi:methylmalonyl-CoA mutase